MKTCTICKCKIERGKYCSDLCKVEGARIKQKEYCAKNKDKRQEYNKEYYKKNSESIKANASLWYSMNKTDACETARAYYMLHHMEWKKYNLTNHAANVGTGSLGSHKNNDVEVEQEFIVKEMKRLRIFDYGKERS